MTINNNNNRSSAMSLSSNSRRNSSSSMSIASGASTMSEMNSSLEDVSARTNISNLSERTPITLQIIEIPNQAENQRIINNLITAPLNNLSFVSLADMTYENSRGNSPNLVNAMPTPVIRETVSRDIFDSDSFSVPSLNVARMLSSAQDDSSSDESDVAKSIKSNKSNADSEDKKPAAKKMRRN